MRQRFSSFMAGRYGSDNLSRFLSFAGMIFLIIFMFTRWSILFVFAIAFIVWVYVRMFSRNIYKRQAENRKYLELKYKLGRKLRLTKTRISQSRYYRFYKCPGCGQTVRVPKGKGHIIITCPKCRKEFERTA